MILVDLCMNFFLILAYFWLPGPGRQEKQEIKRHLRKKWINKNRRQATSASINKMIIIIVYFQKLFIHNKSTNIGADLLKVLS